MKRWTLRILLCVLLGIITTVGVAWGLAWLADFDGVAPDATGTTPEGWHESGLVTHGQIARAWYRPGATLVSSERGQLYTTRYLQTILESKNKASREYALNTVHNEIALGTPVSDVLPWWTADRLGSGELASSERAMDAVLGAGWPIACMWLRQVQLPSGGVSIEGGMTVGYGNRPATGLPTVLPLRPILPGFIINTVLYAGVWFALLFGFTYLKRKIRRQRGRCPMCNYDLRGDIVAGCSECGWLREER